MLLALFGYILWMLGPYLRSTLVRDSAVTAWAHHATAPIAGALDGNPRAPGSRVGSDGRVAEIVNPLADRRPLDLAAADVTRAEARVVALTQLLSDLTQEVSETEAEVRRYALGFTRDLGLAISGTTARLAQIDAELRLLRAIEERARNLSARGFAALTERDEASLRVTVLERQKVELEALLARDRQRLEAASLQVFLLDDGSDPPWAVSSLHQLEQARLEIQAELSAAEADLERAWAAAEAADSAYRRQRSAHVLAQPGAVIGDGDIDQQIVTVDPDGDGFAWRHG
ncbi:MAG: hypothetical protein AAFY02_07450, partial [Pseudomonadota bacterium]